jgi:hypothetical protein
MIQLLLAFRSCLLIIAALIAVIPGWSQTNVGQISGRVYDAKGGAIPDCTVTITSLQTGLKRVAKTDDSGYYVFPSLPAGAYDVLVEKQGFRSTQQSGVVLDATSRRTLDFKVDVGGIAESVSVLATVERVQTNSGDVNRLITDRQLEQIALNGRNYAQLLRLIPGSVSTTTDSFNLALSTTGQRINGIRTNSILFSLDGGENMDSGGNINQVVNPNVDTIAEVKVLSASYSAEFGGHSGAVVNVVTKSGTREFHGSIFEFIRNDLFDARSFFATRVDPLRFNNFGWTLGGPIFIPGKFNIDKTKLFFFAGQEWKYNHQGAPRVSTVPTLEERSGDFRSSSLPAPVDPLNGQTFPDRIVPTSRFSTNGPPLLKPYPLPNFGGPGGNYSFTGVNQTDPREDLLRVDYVLSSKTQLTYRWTHDEWNIFNPFQGSSLGIVPGDRPRPGYVTAVTLNHLFSPTTLNYFSFALTHNIIVATPNNSIMKRDALGLNYPEIYPGNRFGTGPNLNISGFASYSAGDGLKKYIATLQWRDDFSKVVGAHTMKFGVLIIRAREDDHSFTPNDAGTVTFNTSASNTTRNVIADVLLGNFQNYTEELQPGKHWTRYNQFEFYAQDSWRASRKLSLEMGLRYNIIPPITNPLGNSSTFLPNQFDPSRAPLVSAADGSFTPNTGDPYNGIVTFGSDFPAAAEGRILQADDPSLQRLFIGLPRGGNQTSYLDFGPRFGFAYDPFGNGKTSVRGGFGIFYDRLDHDSVIGLTSNPPFNVAVNVFDGNIDNPAGGTNRSFPPSLTGLPIVAKTPRVTSYNLGVQRELPGGVVLDVGFVGTLGRNLRRTININQLPVGTRLNPPNSGINVNALRPHQGYSNISMIDTGENSHYNSLQVTANRRMGKGLSFGVNYTFSKTLDSSSGSPQDSYNVKPDYGLSSIHRAQVFNVNYIYELPWFLKHSNGFLRTVVGGWSIAGVTICQSGAPSSVTVPVDVARIGVGSSRATVVASPKLSSDERTLTRWFNTEAFLPPANMVQGQFGNSGRNILIGPGFIQWDVALMKNFSIRESARLQFRAEAFNIWNHPSFTGINTTVFFDAAGKATQNYGAVNGSVPGRTLEFGLKLLF